MASPKLSSTTPLNPSGSQISDSRYTKMQYITSALAVARTAAGVAALLAPAFTGKLFLLPIGPNSIEGAVLRMWGVREICVGELTWFSRVKPGEKVESVKTEREALRKVVWTNVGIDAMDVGVLAWALYKGSMPKSAIGMLGGAAASMVGMALFAKREI